MSEVTIKVAVRCRPFTYDDKLGVKLLQAEHAEQGSGGEVTLLNSTYSSTRFAFTYAWWSAYGYARHALSNTAEADAMALIDQNAVYSSVGQETKRDLLAGNAVVLFAYGLSGSGKVRRMSLSSTRDAQLSHSTTIALAIAGWSLGGSDCADVLSSRAGRALMR